MAEQTSPRLFISYSHDSREHEDKVRALADRLREDGVDAVVDQYDTAPQDGWPMWMDREIQKADFVALVCTETYLRRVEGRGEPGKGRGVLWEAKLIYNHLYVADSAVQRFIPILLEGGVPTSIPWPLRGLTYYQVDATDGYEDFYRHIAGQPRHERPKLGRLKALPAIVPQSYPASLEVRIERKPPASVDRRNRLQMLKRVRLDWIDGVLKQSLYKVARIELGLEANSDAVDQPLNAIVQVPDRPPTSVPAGTAIIQIFDNHSSAVLILGAPGTGKTTLLLELAQELLDRAEKDESHPMPVVFNLSSWAVRRQPLARWLVAELNERSDVPKRLAQQWVETEQILPLLDGLDEVATDRRQACVEAINDFRRDHGLLPIAVCSRVADYEALGAKLRLRSAVVVQPLSRLQVQDYLQRVGAPLRAFRAALEEQPSLWELVETPLMLWVAVLAYRDARMDFSREASLEQQRRRLFASFVDAMFKRRAEQRRYSPKQTLHWLSWLASALARNQQTVLYLENLGWLSTRPQQWLSKAATVIASTLSAFVTVPLILGVLFGFLFSRTTGPRDWPAAVGIGLIFGLAYLEEASVIGLILGGIVGLIGAFVKLRPTERTRIEPIVLRKAGRIGLLGFVIVWAPTLLILEVKYWQSGNFPASLIWGLVTGLIFAVPTFLLWLIVGLIFRLAGDIIKRRIIRTTRIGPFLTKAGRIALVTGLIVGLAWVLSRRFPIIFAYLEGGLVGGLIVGLILASLAIFFGLSRGTPGASISPNERTRDSTRVALVLPEAGRIALVTGLIVGLGSALWLSAPDIGIVDLEVGVVRGLVVGLILALLTVLFGSSREVPEARARPNEGTRRSMKVAVMLTVGGGLIGLIFGLVFLSSSASNDDLLLAVSCGPLLGLILGGLFSLNHLFHVSCCGSIGQSPSDMCVFSTLRQTASFYARSAVGTSSCTGCSETTSPR